MHSSFLILPRRQKEELFVKLVYYTLHGGKFSLSQEEEELTVQDH